MVKFLSKYLVYLLSATFLRTHNSRCAEEVSRLSQISPTLLAFYFCHLNKTLYPLFLASLNWPASSCITVSASNEISLN